VNKLLSVGALLGVLSVVIGAVADHGPLSGEMAESVATAIRYHQLGAVMIVILAIAGLRAGAGAQPGFRRTGWLFVAGTLLFSLSIYAAALTGIGALTLVTPLGGLTLMAAWLSLLWVALRDFGH